LEEIIMAAQVLRRTFTVDEYHQMAQTGILCEDDRVELLEGEIIEMTPIGPRHAARVDRLTRLFSLNLGEAVIVRVQSPISLTEYSEPQPDLALLRPNPDFYAQAHPAPEDVLLVVEVAETSAAVDREKKVPLYGRAGIGEAWLVDLAGECVEVYLKPSPYGYREVRRFWRGDHFSPQAFPDLELAVDDVLG